MSLLKRIRWFLDYPRLEKEYKESIERLQLGLSLANARQFHAVAEDFDPAPIFDQVVDTIYDEISPMLRDSAVQMLTEAFSQVKINRQGRSPLSGKVAVDEFGFYQVELHLDEINIRVKCYNTYREN